ncbi:TetR/AcrR family transcriptional regulator [Leuconostoc falkenbergense]|uniref:TetR/AcrR family transcriptional regulator n=1 Tax=Leuconostoc falkenbergense TaxID=2766470 RepID=UPI0024AD253E|nr:TetR/AcrR family transcriptional regulator [Leuconostoc falkenbergense]MDI6666727.1 TetR/AcrR family transcriptional regulator [Leuconostoc falkenbergense]
MDDNKRNVTEENREKITAALLKLLETECLNDILVGDISETAGVSKRTFYRAFHTKESVLSHYGDDSFKQYVNQIKQLNHPTFFEVIATLFEFWYERRVIAKTLIDQNLFFLIFKQGEQKLIDTYLLLDFDWHATNTKDTEEINMVMQFMLGGLSQFIQNWLKVSAPLTPEIISQKFNKMINDFYLLVQ